MNARAERWHRVSELFDRVADLEAGERERVLSAECAGDPTLRAEVERLLQADERTCPVDHDIAAQASTLLLEGDPHEHEGELFGPYRIVRLLGQGGMGRVYLAEREGEDFAQTVALKLVGGYGNFDAALARRRFLDERRILARLQHPHIARLLDGGVGPEAQPWFAMEYVDGAPLTEWCDARKLGVRERLELFAKVCDAVDHAHRFLIVHRDIKPGNVLVDAQGEPKVLDFGIAKLLDEADHARTGSTILMTPDYAAPEQIRGGQISTATDVYALGAVLFELLTGRKPFCDPLASREPPQASRVATEAGDKTSERAAARSTTPQGLRKQLRGDIDRILRTALDPDPARRYRSATWLAEDLRAVAEGRAISLRRDTAYRMRVFLRRHRLGAAAAAVAVLALLGTTGWALWQTREATEQASEAARQAEMAKKEALASENAIKVLVSAFEAADPSSRTTLVEPSAKDVLDRSAAKIAEELVETPELLARMQSSLGQAYLGLRHSDKAAELLDASIAGYMSSAVNRPDKALEPMHLRTLVATQRHDQEEAIAMAKRIVALQKQSGATLEEQVGSYNLLGMALTSPGHWKEAEQAYATAHALSIKAFGPVSPSVAGVIHNRGYLAVEFGKMREAERLLREAFRMRVQVDDKPRKLYVTRGVLALALTGQAKFAEAENALKENMRVAALLYGKDSPSMLIVETRLADLYQQQGDLRSAQAHYETAISIASRVFGPSSAETGDSIGKLAKVQQMRGDIKHAEANHGRAEKMLAATVPETEDRRLRAVVNRQLFLHNHDLSGFSEETFKSKLAAWIALYEFPSAHIPRELGEALFAGVEYGITTKDFEYALSLLPPADPTLEQPMMQARRYHLLAQIKGLRGDMADALADYERAISIAHDKAGPDSAWVALWRVNYAEQLAKAGRAREAMKQLAIARPVLAQQLLPASPPWTRMERLAHRIAIGNGGSRRVAVSRAD